MSGNSTSCCKNKYIYFFFIDDDNNVATFTMNELKTIFAVYGIGNFISFITFLVENLVHNKLKIKNMFLRKIL